MIISASRRTDIPAFFSEWFINRIKEGFLDVRNPMNSSQISRLLLSPDIVDCIVFWTKNPIPMLAKLDELRDYCYYFQFTLTGYGRDIESNLPDKRKDLIPAFRKLSDKIGPERVIWRYDPILINDRYSLDYHRKAFEEIADALNGYTEKCVFSFVDLYGKNRTAMRKLAVEEPSEEEMRSIAVHIRDVTRATHMTAATCAEVIDLEELGIEHNACIDRALIERLTGGKIKETKKNLKDSGQRKACKCMASREIGMHNTCGNGCIYCYANYSPESVQRNLKKYDPASTMLCDKIGPGETVAIPKDMRSLIQKDGQLSLFDTV